jgi:DnaJ domain
MSEIQSYPLCWPEGWRRAAQRKEAQFNMHELRSDGSKGARWLTIPDAIRRVESELGRLNVKPDDVVISTNIRPTLSGTPASRGQGSNVVDPGVAVYWRKGRQQRCMAVDRYTTVADNLAAIAATLRAMRAIERHGGAEILDRAFTGFVALPAPEQWFQVLGVRAGASADEIDSAYRRLAMEHHPDRGGDPAQMARINAARDEAHRC